MIPPLSFIDRVFFNATSGGTGSFRVASAITGYQTMSSAGAVSNALYGYAAQSADLTSWEVGWGIWNGTVLARNVLFNSNNNQTAVNFSSAPQVMITIPGESLTLTATANMTFYVSTTGSDNNPGTMALPFLTTQYAINALSRINWQNLYQPTLQYAHGTYDGAIVGPMINLVSALRVFGDNASPSSVIFSSQWQVQGGVFSTFTIGGCSFTGVTAGSCINMVTGNLGINGPVIFNDNGQAPIYFEGLAFGFIGNQTLTVNATSIPWFAFLGPGVIFFFNTTINLPVALTVTQAFFEVEGIYDGSQTIGVASLTTSSVTWGNFGGVTGPRLNAGGFSFTTTVNGQLTDIPGTTNGVQDATAVFTGGGRFGTFFASKSGLPATTDIPAGCSLIIKDTSGGGLYLAANDGGSIKKVALT